jgi:hypothetical protein
MYLATAATGLRIIEKVCLAYSQYTWQFYLAKIFGCVVFTSEPLVRSQLSKSFPSEDLGKLQQINIKPFLNLSFDYYSNNNLQVKYMRS